MVFEILTFDFYLEEKRQLSTTVHMNARYNNEKMKELVHPHPILCIASKFVSNITTKRFIG